jgi:hypothetical protein
MKHAIYASLVATLLSGCVTRPYYGRRVLEERGRLVCGLHRVAVEAHEGYHFNGLMHFVDEESRNFASERYPNVLPGTFSEEKSEDYSLSFTAYTCAVCEAGRKKLERLPMWYKRIAGWPAKVRREIQIERAAAKAKRTGNPDDARVPAGDGYISRIR